VPEDVAPTAAPPSPELTQVLQSMARDLATLGQEIEQLKAGQEQMARDNANTAEQLKASREQMARVLAKASEQNLRPKMSAPPPRPIATPTRRPVPTL
jgi:DNA repair ATPase RecN